MLDPVQGDTAGAQEALLALEKQCRLAEDLALSRESCTAILDVLQAAGDWKGLLEHITMLTKRRGQLKATIQVFIIHSSSLCQLLRFQQIIFVHAFSACSEQTSKLLFVLHQQQVSTLQLRV